MVTLCVHVLQIKRLFSHIMMCRSVWQSLLLNYWCCFRFFVVYLQVLPSKQQQRLRHVVRPPNSLLLLPAPLRILLISTGVLSLLVCLSVLCCFCVDWRTFRWLRHPLTIGRYYFRCFVHSLSISRAVIHSPFISCVVIFSPEFCRVVLWFLFYQWSQCAASVARWRGGSDQAHDGQDEN